MHGEKGQLTITHGEEIYEYNSAADYSRVMSKILGPKPQKPEEGTISSSMQNDDTIIGGKKYKLEIKLYETPIEVGGKTFKIATKVIDPKNPDSEHIQPIYKFVSRDLAMKLAYDMARGGASRA
jgi:hypothetical protein